MKSSEARERSREAVASKQTKRHKKPGLGEREELTSILTASFSSQEQRGLGGGEGK